MADNFDLFKTAPKDVTRYFDAKQSKPTFDYREIAPQEHAFSWTVAKSAGFDILDDIRSAMRDAITNQLPFEHFRQNLTPVLQQKGWWGRKLLADPESGELINAQLGSPRRLRTIYWSNVSSAYAAGQWAKTQRTKRFLPFLVYLLSVSIEKRPEHETWVGIVLPVDDPFWETHYPPNGWGCKCRIRQISRAEAERLGWREGQPAPVVVMKSWHNSRTGETMTVPEGIDPGWQTNPGKNRAENVSEFLYGKVASMPPHRQDIAIQDIVGSPAMEALSRGVLDGESFLPVAQIAQKFVEAFGSSTPIVRLSSQSVKHILDDHDERALATDDFRQAISILRNPEAVIRRGEKSAAFVGAVKGVWWRVVVKSTNNGMEWWLSSFHRKSEKDVRSFIRAAEKKQNLVE